jgi:hypothetical protein
VAPGTVVPEGWLTISGYAEKYGIWPRQHRKSVDAELHRTRVELQELKKNIPLSDLLAKFRELARAR